MGLLTALFFTLTLWATSDCPARTDFDQIVKPVTEKFYDRSFRGLNWPERVRFYREKVRCGEDAAALAKSVNSLLAELRASHTGVYTPEDLKYWALKSIFARGDLKKYPIAFNGIWPVEYNGESYAAFVLEDSVAAKVGVKAGDPIDSHLKNLKGPQLSMQEHFLNATIHSKRVFNRGKKVIGYLHLWCGTHDKFLEALEAALAEFKAQKVNGVIVDLRDGFGGAGPDYLRTLSEDPFYKKIPKVFIINGGVTSGKELLAALIRRDKIGTLVGTKTAGAFLAGAPFEPLGERFFIYLAVRKFEPPGLPQIEGIGVQPDVEVQACKMNCKGTDPQLEAAIGRF